MIVTLLTEHPCACGYRNRGVATAVVRVRKRSLYVIPDDAGRLLSFLPRVCRECDGPLLLAERARARLTPEDAERVAAYRAVRWPVTA